MKEPKDQKRTVLYSIGWIRQKGEWLNALKQFSGRTWIDMPNVEARIREQLNDGSAYVDSGGNRVGSKDEATFIRLKTKVIVDANKLGGNSRYVVIKFRRNRYDMWEGLDFELGDEVAAKDLADDNDQAQREDPLLEDVFFIDPQQWKLDLSEKAVKEIWDNGQDKTGTGLLLPYLRYTYARLKLDGKISCSRDERYMAFNTGLVSREKLDPIIAICKKNDPKYKQSWVFHRFIVWSKQEVEPEDEDMMERFAQVPEGVSWFNYIQQAILSPDDIVLNQDELREQFRPIFSEQKRVPPQILLRIASYYKKEKVKGRLQKLIENEGVSWNEEDTLAYNDIVRQLEEDLGQDVVVERALKFLEASMELARKRLRWEVGTAVPMYAAYKGGQAISFSFMLPLSFDEKNPLNPDVAVVLEPFTDTSGKVVYKPQFLLTLMYAYRNARLLRRPEARWLCEWIEKRTQESGRMTAK